jgi:squalene-hopene/tetraprenyl-beta-curcumene cyclase
MYLCALGEYDYDAVPAIPPEIVLFPNWFYFNIYEISSWSRSILVPLASCYAKKPFKKIPRAGNRRAIRGRPRQLILRLRMGPQVDHLLAQLLHRSRPAHALGRGGSHPPPAHAGPQARGEVDAERLEMTDGLGAIYPAMLNAIIALRCLGYSEDDPQVIRARDEFEKLGIESRPTRHARAHLPHEPCVSPVWDTAQAVFALGEAGVPRNDPRMIKAADWMLSKEVRHKGDWAVKVPNTEPGGWYFEFNNEFYPDTDDTAQVLLALNKVDNPRERYQHQVAQRAIEWEFAMQCKNGGWGSFDKDNTKMIFQYIPFADHNAMLDPPTVDITGRMLEMLANYGYTRDDKRVEKAIKFIFKRAGAGRKLVWPLGRQLHLRHLPGAARTRSHRRRSSRAADSAGRRVDSHGAESRWRLGRNLRQLRRSQHARRGPSTPSQTAWALLGLLAAGDDRSDSLAKGRSLAAHSPASPDGSWDESMGEGKLRQSIITGTGFPRVFYLAYTMYRQYFPLMALTSYKRAMERAALATSFWLVVRAVSTVLGL